MVIVHSFSRFFRDHFELEFYVRKLARNGVKLVSMTQELGDDPMHVMMRQIMALFDEYQSKENARQGFWNGSLPPIGYRVVDAEKRGAKVKKKLEIDLLHADTVRLAFRLALEGDGTSGRMGVKAIAKHLNERRLYTRTGGRWGVGVVHRMLTRPTYIGRHEFNKRSKAKVAPPQVVCGPTLLTGICFCAGCGGAMTIRIGKSGHYRYYTCSIAARQGATGCKGHSVPMQKLDDLVAAHLEERLLDPERLEEVLGNLLDRREERARRRQAITAELAKRAAEADARLKRLYDAIERGLADLDDPALKDRIAELKATREQAQADAERARVAAQSMGAEITPDKLRSFAEAARRGIRSPVGYRRDHLRALA